MRIWDIPIKDLCDRHLLGMHRELHCIFSFITKGNGGSYQRHPEVNRWRSHIIPLAKVHDGIVVEMRDRKFNHKSDLPLVSVQSITVYPDPITPIHKQIERIRAKKCNCEI